jgi:hypothetical protein
MSKKPEIRPPDAEQMLNVALQQLMANLNNGTGQVRIRLPELWDRCVSLIDRNTRIYSETSLASPKEEHSLYKNRGKTEY